MNMDEDFLRYHSMNKQKLLNILKERLRSERHKMFEKTNKKVTQADVAKIVGISRSHLAAAESGHALLSLEAVIQLANFYDVSLDSLVGRPIKANEGHAHSIKTDEEAAFIRTLRAMSKEERQSLIVFFSKLIRQNKSA